MQPPTGVFSASAVASRAFQCCQGEQAWGRATREWGRGRTWVSNPTQHIPAPRRLPVPYPSEPTTMLSLQLTTDAPSPCWALKVWKVWEPTFRVSSSGGHKKGWRAEARLSTFLLAPPFPCAELTEVEGQRSALAALCPPGAQEHATRLLQTATQGPRGAHDDGHAA